MQHMIVHVGAHRTATTFVQSTLARNANALTTDGVDYRPISAETATPISVLRQSDSDEDVQTAAEAFLTRYQTDLPVSLVSWEGLLGMPFVEGRLYGGRAPFLRMLRCVRDMANCPMDIVLTVRRQDDFINSWYAQLVKAGATLSAKEYRSEFNGKKLDWLPLAEDFRQSFNLVNVVPYELLRAGVPSYLAAMFSGTPVDASTLETLAKVENSSYSAAALKIALFVNEHVALGKAERAAFRKILLANAKEGEPASVLSDVARQKIVQRYRHSNALLLDDPSLPTSVLRYYSISRPFWQGIFGRPKSGTSPVAKGAGSSHR